MDGTGNVYVADKHNQTVRKVSPAGVVSTLAGLAGIAPECLKLNLLHSLSLAVNRLVIAGIASVSQPLYPEGVP